MSRAFILFCTLLLINFANSFHSQSVELLDNVIDTTNDLFAKLQKDFETSALTNETIDTIDKKINDFLSDIKRPGQGRVKRFANSQELGVNVVHGFVDIPWYGLPNAIDLVFLIHHNKFDKFAIALEPSEIRLYQLLENDFFPIGSLPIKNGYRIIANTVDSKALLVVQMTNGDLVILRLGRRHGQYALQAVQNLSIKNLKYITLWHGMNQLYLGVASSDQVAIYLWMGEHFDLVQPVDTGATKLLSFKTGGSMYLVLSGKEITVMKYYLRTEEFKEVQRLPGANDVETFRFKDGFQRENFLTLIRNGSTVIYKWNRNRFVPFQQIQRANGVFTLATDQTIIIMPLLDQVLSVYQYDGWRFHQLEPHVRNVTQMKSQNIFGQQFLFLREMKKASWSVKSPVWRRVHSWKSLKTDITAWCNYAKMQVFSAPSQLPQMSGTLQINGHIQNLRVDKINSTEAEQLKSLTKGYKELVAKMATQREQLANTITTVDPTFRSLRANKISLTCTGTCSANNTLAPISDDLFTSLRKVTDENGVMEFEHIKTQEVKNSPCPKVAFNFEKTFVTGNINGIPFSQLEKKVLKVSGDQDVTGNIVFQSLTATNANLPLDIAFNSTKQEIEADEITADELTLSEGGILLPIDGEPTTITGTIFADKVTVTGVVEMNGGFDGEAIRRLAPVMYIDEPFEIKSDYFMKNVTISNILQANDLSRDDGKSLNEIRKNVVPLNENVPVHLVLSQDKVAWKNVKLTNTPNWAMLHSQDLINITGKKIIASSLDVPHELYKKFEDELKPKLDLHLCGSAAIAKDIKTSSITLGNIKAKYIKAESLNGAADLNAVIQDTAISPEDIDFSKKVISGKMEVQEAALTTLKRQAVQDLLDSFGKWSEPGVIKGPLNVINLDVKRLESSRGLKIEVPVEVKDVTCEGNLAVGNMNGINFSSFIDSVVQLDKEYSINHATFLGRLEANQVKATVSTVPFYRSNNLGSKTIKNKLSVNALYAPDIMQYPSGLEPTSFTVKGSAIFTKEPEVNFIEGVSLKYITEQAWLKNRKTILPERSWNITSLNIKSSSKVNQMSTPHHGTWNDLEQRLFSRTKYQEIEQDVFIQSIDVPSVTGTPNSQITSPQLYELSAYSLKRDRPQVISNTIEFEHLKISGNLNLNGKINGMNLAYDVVRSDVDKNIITGKKAFAELTVTNLNALGFGEWAKGALLKNNAKRVAIKGKKVFNRLGMTSARLDGGLNGHQLEDFMVKSSDQNITGIKSIHGSVHAPSMNVDGLINDVNIANVLLNQFKKSKPSQIVESELAFLRNLNIVGNLTIEGLCQGVEISENMSRIDSGVTNVFDKVTTLNEVASGINHALQRRALYWDKLQIVEKSYSKPIAVINDSITFDRLGECSIINHDVICNDRKMLNLTGKTGAHDLLFTKLFNLIDTPTVVAVSPHYLAIYTYDKSQFHQTQGIYLPVASEAFAITTGTSIWIALSVPMHTMVFRYDPWEDLRLHTIPRSGEMLLDQTPIGEPLIIRSDGVWKLSGLAGPRLVFKATMNGKIRGVPNLMDYYVQLENNNSTNLLKSRYIGV